MINSFVRPDEQALAEEFAANGYVVRPVDDRDALDELRRLVAQIVCDQLKIQLPNDIDDFLNHVERVVPIEKLNEVRLNTYRKMNAAPWFRPTYFGLARSIIETLVGNELAMQNRDQPLDPVAARRFLVAGHPCRRLRRRDAVSGGRMAAAGRLLQDQVDVHFAARKVRSRLCGLHAL